VWNGTLTDFYFPKARGALAFLPLIRDPGYSLRTSFTPLASRSWRPNIAARPGRLTAAHVAKRYCRKEQELEGTHGYLETFFAPPRCGEDITQRWIADYRKQSATDLRRPQISRNCWEK
jgi:hypothetical protein